MIRALFEFFNSSPDIVNKIGDLKLIGDISFQWFNEVGYVVRALRRYRKILQRSILGFNPLQYVEQQAWLEITEWIDVIQFRFARVSVLLRIKRGGVVHGKRLH